MSAQHAYTLPFGAELLCTDRTLFRLWAPSAKSVAVEIPDCEPVPMRAVERGFYEIEIACGAGTRYRYRIDNEIAVPDPASRLQDGDVHDASIVVDAKKFAWQHDAWCGRPWHEMVIYEIHAGCCGGFSGIEAQLATLAELGITALELMPIADFPGQRNWGYDGVLPFAPDTSYGTPDQLKQLIDCAHSLGICVYLDVVYNHFGPDGNFLHRYAAPFFDEKKSSPWGTAIDFLQPQVRRFFIENALYWLQEYRFDGLRFDAVHAIDDPSWLDEMASEIRVRVQPGREVHLMLENEHNRAEHLRGSENSARVRSVFDAPHDGPVTGEFDAQWNDDGHNALHVLLTGEHDSYYANYRDQPAQKLARCLAEGFAYQGEISPLQQRPRGTSSAHLPPTAFVLFLQNHDQIGNRAFGERLTVLTSEAKLRAATTLLLLSPQIPLLFMGDPWGVRTPFFFSPISIMNWRARCAKDAVASLPRCRRSKIRRSAKKSPIPMPRRHSPHRFHAATRTMSPTTAS